MQVDRGFDPEQLRARYREERAKRLRSDGNEQYRAVAGEYAWMLKDPNSSEQRTRPPAKDLVEITVVGGGLAGITVACELRKKGFADIRMIDDAGDFGGTWYWNRFPGAQCDIESYIYMPLLEEVGYMPKMKYSMSSEIRGHLQNLAKRFDLYRDVLFRTQVKQMSWNEDDSCWSIETNQGDHFKSRFVCVCNGPLTQPKLPGIPGIETFKGHMFHTSRWDYDYTGGDENGNLVKLADKRVGIIGTGGTAVQVVPHLGRAAKELFVFQRTPSAVDERNNRPTDEQWFRSLEPGWQRQRMANFIENVHGDPAGVDLVDDGWTRMAKELTALAVQKASSELGRPLTKVERAQLLDIADFRTMEKIRDRVETIVDDPQTAEALKPWYARWCKRPCFHDEYLPTFNRPSVRLVDTNGKGVERFTPDGVIVDGVEHALDCLVLATGFSVGNNHVERLGYDILGRNGVSLAAKWDAGLKTFHGMHVHDFPNMFFTGITQTGVTYNYTIMLTHQADHLAYILEQVKARGLSLIEASADAESNWVDEIRRLARRGTAYYEECTPGYFTNEGKLDEPNGLVSGAYGLGPKAFWDLLEKWREDGDLQGLELKTAKEQPACA